MPSLIGGPGLNFTFVLVLLCKLVDQLVQMLFQLPGRVVPSVVTLVSMFIVLSIFIGAAVALISCSLFLRDQRRELEHRARMTALEKGEPLPVGPSRTTTV